MGEKRTVAVATEDKLGLSGEVAMHFGRCPFFTLVEIEDGSIGDVAIVPNPHFDQHQPGVMPRFIQGFGAQVILAGGMGPRAVQTFRSFGMDVVTGVVGTVDKVLEAYLDGTATGIVPCRHDHPESCGGHGP